MKTTTLKVSVPKRVIGLLGALLILSSASGPAVATGPCELEDHDGEKCVGRPNELVGSCTGGQCPDADKSDPCSARIVNEYDYIGCTMCISGGSGDKCSAYHDPTACEDSTCQYKVRSRACFCQGTQCVLDPTSLGNYGELMNVKKKDCVL